MNFFNTFDSNDLSFYDFTDILIECCLLKNYLGAFIAFLCRDVFMFVYIWGVSDTPVGTALKTLCKLFIQCRNILQAFSFHYEAKNDVFTALTFAWFSIYHVSCCLWARLT